LNHWIDNYNNKSVDVIVGHNLSPTNSPKGVGFAKNRAVEQSDGQYLCFLDSDDIMLENRLQKQYEIAKLNKDAIIGSKFIREPIDSTKRYTVWANQLSEKQLYDQIYTSFGPTLLMPTWFCSRELFHKVGGFDETGFGVPEDLIFFYSHLNSGGKLLRVDEELLIYRYHSQQTTFSIAEQTIWNIRLEQFESKVLSKWKNFMIWNAGKEGKRLYRSLSQENRAKVLAFCDVDQKKISKGFYTYEESNIRPKPKVPIIHFSSLTPPVVICVKLGLTSGQFERNLSSLNLNEGIDYFHFG
jgi:glycosyltransferase involved in cell wall biosynthesis